MAITAFLSRSPRLLNRGPGGPASLGHGPHSSIFSPTDLNSNWLNRESWGPPLLGAGSLYSIFTPTELELPVHRVISLFYVPSIQPVDSQGYPLNTFDRMHLLFTQVHSYFDSSAGVNMQY